MGKFKPCSCDVCRSMCKRPCWGTPADIQNIIDAGYGKRLMLDYWVRSEDEGGYIYILSPALKNFEDQQAPWMPRDDEGCTFWNKDQLCDLHDKGLKPTEGKLAIHDMSDNLTGKNHGKMAMSWDTDEGRKLVEEWKNE
jgi:hypothetical protein